MKKKYEPLFLYHEDLKKLLDRSDKTVYRNSKEIRAFFDLPKKAPIGLHHFSLFYNMPKEEILRRLNDSQ